MHTIYTKCWEKELFIYPLPIKESYYENKQRINKCKIVIKTGQKEIIGKGIYKQNEELYNKINELYLHYSNKI